MSYSDKILIGAIGSKFRYTTLYDFVPDNCSLFTVT